MKKNYSNLGNVLNRLNRSVTAAFDRVSRTFGEPVDPDVRMYQSLHPEDVAKLAEIYGQDNVLDYIRKMEGKRLMGGSYGAIRYRKI